MADSGFTRIGDMPQLVGIAKKHKPLTRVQQRLLDCAVDDDTDHPILFQHAVLCQTCLPLDDPGDEVRTWERLNGYMHLKVLAGEAMHPKRRRLVPLGLPFGPKARRILMHINQQAIREQSPEIDVQKTLTKFVSESLKLASHGRNIGVVKDQLARLAAASIRLGVVKDGHALTVNSQIVSAFDIWFPKNERQRVLWPSIIRLSLDYWASLKAHAVPLDESHIVALSHSALALDIYSWLAHRLWRIPGDRPVTISWAALQAQFGPGYGRRDNFRAKFKIALKQVLVVYQEACVDLHEGEEQRFLTPDGQVRCRPSKGLTLHCSPPLVPFKGDRLTDCF